MAELWERIRILNALFPPRHRVPPPAPASRSLSSPQRLQRRPRSEGEDGCKRLGLLLPWAARRVDHARAEYRKFEYRKFKRPFPLERPFPLRLFHRPRPSTPCHPAPAGARARAYPFRPAPPGALRRTGA
jgi:hypothetical protein